MTLTTWVFPVPSRDRWLQVDRELFWSSSSVNGWGMASWPIPGPCWAAAFTRGELFVLQCRVPDATVRIQEAVSPVDEEGEQV